MLAGARSHAGYFMGEQFRPGNALNPKGFFEDKEINRINEELLAPVTAERPKGLLGSFYRSRPVHGQRWLAMVPVGTPIPCPPTLAQRIAAQSAKRPFCFKDPRFSYTLPAWRPFLDRDTVFICMFRDPAKSALSMVQASQAMYNGHLRLGFAQALRVWLCMYQHILTVHRQTGTWLFLHYVQVVDGAGLAKVEALLGVSVDRQFPDERLNRSVANGVANSPIWRVYHQLCDLAAFRLRAS